MTLFGHHHRDQHRSNHHRPTTIVDQPPLTSTVTHQYQNNSNSRPPGNTIVYDAAPDGHYVATQPYLTTEPVVVGGGGGGRGATKNGNVVRSKVYGEEIENVHVSDATDSSDNSLHKQHNKQNGAGRQHHNKMPIKAGDLGPAEIIANQNNTNSIYTRQKSDGLYAQPVDKILYGDKYVESSGAGTGNSNNDSDTTLRQQKRNVNFAAPIVAEQQQYVTTKTTTRIPNPLYQQHPSTIVGTRRVEDQIVNVPQVQVVHTERWLEGRSPSPELERIRREEIDRMRQEQRAEREYSERVQQQQQLQQQQRYEQEVQQPKVIVERRVETTTTTTTSDGTNNNRNQSSPTSRRRSWQQKTSISSSSSSNSANAGRARSPPPQSHTTMADVVVQHKLQRDGKPFSSSKAEHQREAQYLSDDQQRTTIPVEYVPTQQPQTMTSYEREVVQDSHPNGQSQQQQQRTVQVEQTTSGQQFPHGNGREFFRQKVDEIRERHKSGGRPEYPPQSQRYNTSQTSSSYQTPNVTVNGASPAPAAQQAETAGRYSTSSYSAKTFSSSNGAAAATTANDTNQSLDMAQQRQAAIVNNANNLYATIQRESRSRNRESTAENNNSSPQQQKQQSGANAASAAYYSTYSSTQSGGAEGQQPKRTDSPQYIQTSDLQLVQQPAPPPRNSSLNYQAHYRRHHHHRHHGSRSRSGSRHHTSHVSGGGGNVMDRSPSPLPNGNAVANAVEQRQQTVSPTKQVVQRTVTTKTKTVREELPAPPAVPNQQQEVQQVNVVLSSDDASARRTAANNSYYAVSNKHVDRSPSTRRDTTSANVVQQRVRAGSTTSSTASSIAAAHNNSFRNGHISPARQKYEDRRQMQRQFEQSVSRGGSMQNLANVDNRPIASYPVQPTPNSSARSVLNVQEVQYQAPRAGIRPVHALYRSHSTNGPRDQYYQQRYVPLQQQQPSQFVLVQPQSRAVSVDRLAPPQQIYASVTPARSEPGTETVYHEREDIFIHNTPDEVVVQKKWGFGPPYFNKDMKNRDDENDYHRRHVADEEYDTAPPALYNDGVYSPSTDNHRVRRKKSLYRRLSAMVKGGGNRGADANSDYNDGYVNNRADYYRPTNANAYAPNPQYGPVIVDQKPPAPVPAYSVQRISEPQHTPQQTYTTYYTPPPQNVTVLPPQQATTTTWKTVDSAPSAAVVQPTNARHFETIDSTGTRHHYVTETLPAAATRRKTETEIIYNVPPQPRELLAYAPKDLGRTIPVSPPYAGYTPPLSPTHDSYYYVRNDAGNSVLTPTVNVATGQPVLNSNTQYYYTQPQTVKYVPSVVTTVVPQQQVLVSNGQLVRQSDNLLLRHPRNISVLPLSANFFNSSTFNTQTAQAAPAQPVYFERRLRREAAPGHVMYEVNERRSVSPASGMFLGASAAKSSTYVANPVPPLQQQQVVRTTETTTTSYPPSAVVVDHRRPPPAPRSEYVAPNQLHHRHQNHHQHQRTAPRGILAQPPHVVQDRYNDRIHREVLTD